MWLISEPSCFIWYVNEEQHFWKTLEYMVSLIYLNWEEPSEVNFAHL